MKKIDIVYSDPKQIQRCLKVVRGSRYYMPRYAWFGAFGRALIIVLPVTLLFLGYIDSHVLLGFASGYLAHRIFELKIKPYIYRKAAPHFALQMKYWPQRVTLDANGVHFKSRTAATWVSWAALPSPEFRKKESLFVWNRNGHCQSLKMACLMI
ncbi:MULTISPECIES: hypothetical protein [Rhodobacterales]|uniref:hypothetical protein n=1 Tax=Rhodobacterales TaxID=204455 RepID=UPI0011BD49D6|nr:MULTISPECIES: hypothetical protein [Rhodobacterales]MDO6590828.1 hypothetical protein [Yoonia sp. 1_MG-2023]